MRNHFFICVIACVVILSAAWAGGPVHAEPMRVLWWDVSLNESRNKPANRQRMAQYLTAYQGGTRFAVDYEFKPQRGAFAKHVAAQPPYQMIIVTAANNNRVFNSADLEAFKQIYTNTGRALMLDGTLGIRNSDVRSRTKWPGTNGSSANMLVNQAEAMREAGGGLFIGTDHGQFQASANLVVRALIPDARFSQITDPSRDGEFFGELLLAFKEPVKPLDMLRHWEAIPNQGQAPVGQFTDFTGQPVTLFTLVEASNKPGGKQRRPYISATIDPGDQRFDIADDAAPVIDRMPTRKSRPTD
ncbi:MAG: hypothetical protein AB8B47_05465 [Roseobacter sp.]